MALQPNGFVLQLPLWQFPVSRKIYIYNANPKHFMKEVGVETKIIKRSFALITH
jgi:hypothetical protein